MLDEATIEALARAYHVAEKERRRTRAPSVLHPGFTIEDAYAVQRRWVELKLAEGDLRWVAVLCHRNNVIEESGVAAAVLNHPANGVAWLADKLAPFDLALEPGQFILSGSFTGTVEARAGDTFHIDYGPLGSISCRFA